MASSHATWSLSGTEPEGEPRHRGDANRLSDDETDDDPQGDARRRGGAQGVKTQSSPALARGKEPDAELALGPRCRIKPDPYDASDARP
jgi:hypothetical protein